MKNITLISSLSALLFVIFIVSACAGPEPSEESMAYHENYELTGSEKAEVLNNVSSTILEPADRTVSGEAANISVEDIYEEFTLESGRYEFSGDGGNIKIFDGEGDDLIYETVGGGGVISLTVDITEDHTVRVDGYEHLSITPAETAPSNELSAGIWEVGLDIDPGEYLVTVPGGQGTLQKFSPDGSAAVYELLTGSAVSTESRVQLEEGQKLRISRVSSVEFSPAD